MLSTQYVETPCPHCGYLLDFATGVFDNTLLPNPGDASVCAVCGGFLIFSDNLTPRAATMEEVAYWPDELRIMMQRMREVVVGMNHNN
jgi:hypothetical protein